MLKEKYGLEIESVPLETPPDLRLGEIATPIAFELARKLRKAPKVIAQEIVSGVGEVEGFAGFEVAGAGYINARLDRAAAVRMMVESRLSDKNKSVAKAGHPESNSTKGHALVEHTSINPNKAAHIGHLRNAILGDTFVRLLRAAGYKVDVQNYIDNTGVQVADVVVGLQHIRGMNLADVRMLIKEFDRAHAGLPQFGRQRTEMESQILADAYGLDYKHNLDYFCWHLYATVSSWYEHRQGSFNYNDPTDRKQIRLETLHLIEEGGNDTAEIADLVSTAVLRRHLETMLRLGIEYDFLPRESEILALKFWESAFEKLKQTGVLYFENEGKNKGCWVMTRPGVAAEPVQNEDGTKNADEDAKVIVRSNGTVTYVGKDIAYHLWKFGLLGRDFGYKRFFTYPDHECWISTETGEPNHPHFGGATAIYNVIDSRQSDPQANVIQALRGMGYAEQADHYTHFSYEMVALTPRCAVELGYNVSEEDQKKSYIEVSGRKGFGVKADDLIDKLIAATRAEVDTRQTSGDEAVRQKIAEQIAIGALRYFMLKVTRNSVIAFDFKDALSFEGETGPYIQYAVVRIRNIFRKGGTTPEAALEAFAKQASQQVSESASRQGTAGGSLSEYLSGEPNEDIWALWLRAGRFSLVLEQCITTSEPAYLAKHAFQLAQEFANFYHRHHILTEEDPARKTFLLATAAIALRELVGSLALLGIESPEAM
ncbi:MAG TPA: arginine--tRNA ligase [Terracidiphilus sp.]